jgi:myo-inositol 2-dehydrogenase / D-chiro-inositol 1-dehydrogenase
MIGIALIGAGRIARVHAKAIGAAGGRLITVYDVVESLAKSLAADVGASVAHSAEEVFARPDVAGLRAAYLADAAGASLRLGRTIELKTNCEVTWHD